MTLLNAWVLFGLIPLYFIYKRAEQHTRQTKLLYVAIVFMFLAMARPALQQSYTEQSFDAHDYIIALDASYSMQAQDLTPSRYLLAKKAIHKLITSHPKDRFTLFAFTSQTLLISPPTTDTAITLAALEALNPEYILTKSTSLHNLFQTIATLPLKQKNLIIFSDGGDDHDIKTLAKLAQKNSIHPYIVATATTRGAALKKNDRYIKDSNEAIVVSKINPMLPDLANATQGKYYKLTSLDIIDTLSQDIASQATKKEKIRTRTYQELFYYPLIVAIVLFFLSVTKLLQRYLLATTILVAFPYPSHASLLDFYYIKQGNKAYQEKRYEEAAELFASASASVQSYYNIATALYKAGRYRDALNVYSQIKTPNKKLKQRIYYNMANAAARSQHYEQAIRFYINALALEPTDADALYNLTLLRKMKLTKTPKDIADMMPKTHNKKEAQKTAKEKQSDSSAGSNSKPKSNPNSGEKNNGGGGNGKKKEQKGGAIEHQKPSQPLYKFTYKAYEKINKGYADEKEPW